MSIADLKNLDDKALVHRELQLERELLDARFRMKTNQLEDTSKLAKIRKGIARARTLQREREIEQSLNPNTLLTESHSPPTGMNRCTDKIGFPT